MKKFCITCEEEGHTYLECKKVGFFDLIAGCVGVPLPSGKTTEQLKKDIQDLAQKRDKEGGTS
jgi:hypothetical protein